MTLERTTNRLRLSIACAALASVAMMLVPICSFTEGTTKKVFSIAVGCAFWISLILEQLFFWNANKGRKRIHAAEFSNMRLKNASVGLFSFGTSREARICDLIMVITLITSIVFNVMRIHNEWLVISSLAILFFAFNMHCILNGRNYRYIKAFHLVRNRTERKSGGNL